MLEKRIRPSRETGAASVTDGNNSTLLPPADIHKSASSTVLHPACGKRWKQRGNLTGHCSRCHETFHGIEIFDLHQKLLPSGRVECLNPANLVYRGEPLFFRDDSWRGLNRRFPGGISAKEPTCGLGRQSPSTAPVDALNSQIAEREGAH